MPLFQSPPPHPRRPRRHAAPSVSPVSRAEPLESRVLLAVFTVTTTADSGPGSLRQAILDANVASNADQIRFAIPGPGVHSISPLTPLPAVMSETVLDATTQPGYAGSPLVELDGAAAGAGADGLTLGAATGNFSSYGKGTIRGFAINRFSGNGIVIFKTYSIVEGNYIGLNPAGDAARPNGAAGVLVRESYVSIGGPAAAQRNVISGNAGPGVRLAPGSFSTSGTRILGNFIGTDASGSTAIGNGGEGVAAEGTASSEIGGITIGGGSPGEGNVISGNGASGIRLAYVGFYPTIRGNRIGTDAAGARALPNGTNATSPWRDGITMVEGRYDSIQIGSKQAADRNVISGNAGSGVRVGTFRLDLKGNFIGTDATGTIDLGNGGDGVTVLGDRSSGFYTVTGNLISGNGGDGIHAEAIAGTNPIAVQGNYIGTDAAGTAALGNDGDGLDLSGMYVRFIGGNFVPATTPPVIDPAGEGRNVISGNGAHGMRLGSTGSFFSSPVAENYIGTDVTGMAPLGNGGSGVYVTAPGWRIGAAFYRNVISANRGDGVTVIGVAGSLSRQTQIERAMIGTDASGGGVGMGNGGSGIRVVDSSGVSVGFFHSNASYSGNTISGNEAGGIVVTGPSELVRVGANFVFSNFGPEIDLGGDGVTPNDPQDADPGPNHLQNFPVITEAAAAPATAEDPAPPLRTLVRFELNSEPLKTYTVMFVAATGADETGHGGAQRMLGQIRVTTDEAGNGSGAALVAPVSAGEFVSAVATDAAGNSSEYSAAVPATPAEVAGRFVFYNRATEQTGAPGAAAPDPVVAPDNYPLASPGEPTESANVTNYSRGINGIVVDLAKVPDGATPTADDFEFRAGTGDIGYAWTDAPAPTSITLRRGAGVGGSDRVTIAWDDAPAVKNGWLQVTVKATPDTALSRPDVFYFGNLVGSAGADTTPLNVDNADLAAVRRRLGRPPTGTDRAYDFDQDGAINVRDLAIARSNFGRTLSPLSSAPQAAPPVAPASTLLDESQRQLARRRQYAL